MHKDPSNFNGTYCNILFAVSAAEPSSVMLISLAIINMDNGARTNRHCIKIQWQAVMTFLKQHRTAAGGQSNV